MAQQDGDGDAETQGSKAGSLLTPRPALASSPVRLGIRSGGASSAFVTRPRLLRPDGLVAGRRGERTVNGRIRLRRSEGRLTQSTTMADRRVTLPELFWCFLKLGCISFGGPVAHLGYFQTEFVQRRRWLSDADYADLVALCQFLPGPASSQVGYAIGLREGALSAGCWRGWVSRCRRRC